MTSKEILLKRIQVCDFTLIEARLFLDTHPQDKEALEFYKKHLAMQKESVNEYTRRFGILNPSQIQDDATRWDWVNNPWPWENSEV